MVKFPVLAQFQQLSRQMMDLAKHGDWDELPDLEQQRTILMRDFFEQQNITASDSDDIAQVIQDVLSINEQIAQLAENQKVTIGQQLHKMKKRQNVHSAYLQNK